MLTPYLYHCPEKLKGILHFDENEKLYFVFGNKCISLELVKALAQHTEGIIITDSTRQTDIKKEN